MATGWSPPAACARTEAEALHRRFTLPGLPLAAALQRVAEASGVAIGTVGPLPAVVTRPVHNETRLATALAHMLAGTGYIARRIGPTAWRIEPAPMPKAGLRQGVQPPLPPGEDIVITAAKRQQTRSTLPMAISVFRMEDVRGGANASTELVAAELDGLTLTDLGPGRNRMFLRGVADSPFDGTSQSTVAVIVDDSRLTYSAPDPDLRLVDVDRVELLKGPQGSLYGTGALGGIYHVVTNQADLARATASITAGAEAVDHGGVGASGSAILNMPVVNDMVAVRLVVYASDEPGWIKTGARDDSNRARVFGARGALGWRLGADWRIDLTALVQELNTADSQYTYASGALARPAQLAEPHDNDLTHVALRAAGPLGASNVVLVMGYTAHQVGDTLDATQGASDFGLANPALFNDLRQYAVWDNEVRVNGELGSLRWLAGLSHVEAWETETRSLGSNGSGTTLQIDTSHHADSDTGIYADVTLPVTPQFDIEGGGRLFQNVLNEHRQGLTASGSDEVHQLGVAPTAALAWRPQTGRLLFVRFGMANRQGGLDYDTDGAIHPYPGDRLTTIEAGWRQEWRDGQIDVGGFYTWWHNMQSDLLLPNGLIETRDAGDAAIAGLEASVQRNLGRNARLELGATVQSARLVHDALGIALDDTRLPAVPDYTLRGALSRQFGLAGAQWTLRWGMRYTGPARLSFEPALDRRMGNILDSDLHIDADWGKTHLGFAVNNPLDRAGNVFAYGNPFRSTTPQFTPQRPPGFSFELTRRF